MVQRIYRNKSTCSSSMENYETTSRARTGRDPEVCKWPEGVWARLGLLLIIVVLVKGLLIGCAIRLLTVDVPESPQRNRTCEKSETTEKLHEELQKLTDLIHLISKDSRCRLCPERWRWFWGHCYFFSPGLEKDRRWGESLDYCAEHNASLAVIQDDTEMEFILGHMMAFPEVPFLWLGLSDSQEEGVWLWQNGTPLHEHSLIKIQWDSEQRDCADLRGNRSVFASGCEVYGPWLCEKPMELSQSDTPFPDSHRSDGTEHFHT